MPPRSVKAAPADWKRLGEWVRNEREIVLGITQDELVNRSAAGISKPVLSILENGSQKNDAMTVRTLRAVSVGLGYSPDSAQRVLKGKEPRRWTPESVVSVADAAKQMNDGERDTELRRLIESLSEYEVIRLIALLDERAKQQKNRLQAVADNRTPDDPDSIEHARRPTGVRPADDET